jgi:hypothetical protein
MTKEYIQHIRDQRKAIYELDCALWRARAEAERESNYHTQLGHAIDALSRLQKVFGLATPSPDTNGTRAWYTIDELNEWAEKQIEKEKNND